ncbi:nucleic-acid-binding protein from transposon X-element [Nephila pilipes]|uniref:Nucleic-acid-binding protein from transposon X-element n=1 Tax=Nephila pilipes TaxID=299642 RepID=A0A8X6Q4U9_NEPPI|nr:nucleic-acid-binding protein from transposon X-element [Nephila pilipes]
MPNEHRIIQNFISVKNLKSHTFEMQNEKMLKVVIRGLPADYDIKKLISEIQLQRLNPDHVSVLCNRRNNTNMPLFLVVLKIITETQDIYNICNIGYFRVKIEALRKFYACSML